MTTALDLRAAAARRKPGLDLRAGGLGSLPNGAQFVTAIDGGKAKYVTAVDGGKTKYVVAQGAAAFTPASIDSAADLGAVAGTFSASTPTGAAATYAIASDPSGLFAISGSNLVLADNPVAGTFPLIVIATDATGWRYRLATSVTVAEGAITLQAVSFSKTPQIGVDATGITIEGILDGVTPSLDVPGLTLDASVRPVKVLGTATAFGDNFAITQTAPNATNSPLVSPVSVMAGAPTFTVQPSLLAGNVYEVGQSVGADPGAAPDGTSVGYKIFRRSGTTGVGTAIPFGEGGDSPTRVIPSSEEGWQYRWRVRWYRGALFGEAYTPWTDTIVLAPPGPPVFTQDPSISVTGSEVGDIATWVPGVATGASGAPARQWVANGVPIEGETGTTYQFQWADRYKVIECLEFRTNSSGKVAVARSSNSATISPKLSRNYHGNPSWFDGSRKRYTTPVLITPYEPGKKGTAKVLNSFSSRQRTFDKRVDFYYRGNLHWQTPGTPMGNAIVNQVGRNGIYWGFETNGWKTQHTRAWGRVSFVGIKGGDVAGDQDQIFYGGSDISVSGYQETDIQGCYLPTKGTYANPFITPNTPSSGYNSAPIKSIERISSGTSGSVRIIIDTVNVPTGFRAPVVVDANGDAGYLIVYGAQVSAGVTTDLNVDWNTNYAVVSYNAATGEIIATPELGSSFGPTNGARAVNNTGQCCVLVKKADNHSDGGQKNKGVAGRTRRDGNTYYGNYTAWGVDGNTSDNDNECIISNENVRRRLDKNPQEYTAPLIYLGLSAGSPYRREATNVYIENTPPRIGFDRMLFPPNDAVTLPNGNQFLPFEGDNWSNWRGGVEYGIPPNGDYAPPSLDVWNYQYQFHNQRDPVSADMTGISLTATPFSGSAAVGTEVGQLILAHNWVDGLNDSAGRPVIVDFVISGPNAGKVSQGWSGLLYTTAATGASAFDIQVAAVVRDSALNYGAAVQFGPVNITITPS